MAYIYRFKDKSDITIYIGYTGQTLDQRLSQHFGDKGHLDQKCYKETCKIEYQKYKTKSDAQIMEVVEINRYKPKYNKLNKQNDDMTLDIIENKWKLYREIRPTKPLRVQNTGFMWKVVAFIYLMFMLGKLLGLI
ncbi:GIY-YIG nuclease family protein [Romboutsia sp.]|uniref:GIY-YIG nuclease family protein n=1 Tax=Romboutsia sp. TaxID=1965302 RepID=UPI002B5CA683|nr:GIY-YIG nuclease family protein [Romboutsia sp.]HSQ88722.1 GIY-YIG nuclease family protein [Romboutsia sp.]